MDRELSKDYLKKKRIKQTVRIGIPAIIVLGIVYVAMGWIKPTVNLSEVATSVAERGSVENSFTTNGTVESFYQEVLTAPLSANIMKILHFPGDLVGPADTLILPDVSLLEAHLHEVDDEIALEENRIQRKQEELHQKETSLRSDLLMDSIKIEQLKSNLENETYLFEIGGGSKQKVNQAKINFELAQINRENLVKEFNSFKRLQQLDIESMELELSLKNQNKNKIQIQLDKAHIRPRIQGMITSILVEPGQHVNQGQALAHVADANNFKVEGEVSTRYADRVFIGQQAIVQINDSILNGKVTAVSPSVESGTINYTVTLATPQHQLLRAKMRVEVRLIQSVNQSAIRLKNSDYYYGPGYTHLFVINGDQLEKRKVKLGGASFDFVEVLNGIEEGETVIISKSFNTQYERYNSIQCVD